MDVGIIDVIVTLNTINTWSKDDTALLMLSTKYRPDVGENVDCMLRQAPSVEDGEDPAEVVDVEALSCYIVEDWTLKVHGPRTSTLE
jgi:hypothetical protein